MKVLKVVLENYKKLAVEYSIEKLILLIFVDSRLSAKKFFN